MTEDFSEYPKLHIATWTVGMLCEIQWGNICKYALKSLAHCIKNMNLLNNLEIYW